MFSFLVLIVVQFVFALDSEESHPSAIEKLGTFKELLKESRHQWLFFFITPVPPSASIRWIVHDFSNIDIIAFHQWHGHMVSLHDKPCWSMLILFLWASMHGIAMMASSHTKLQALALRERLLCPTMSASMLLGSHQLCCPCTEMRRNVNLDCVASCLTG